MDLAPVPRHLVVLGGGYVGAELAQAYRRFGAEVTLIGRNPRLVAHEEPEVSAVLAQALSAEEVRLRLGQEAERVEPGPGGPIVHVGGERVAASHLLVATGRRPNTQDLGLDAAGVGLHDDGAIAVDERMRTSVDGIWAIGDVNGQQPFTRVCQEEAKVAFADAFGNGHPGLDRRPLGHAVFTDPEIGSVGLTEAAARAEGLDVAAGSVGLDQVEKAELMGETRGVIKIVVERGSRRLLGLHVAAPSAGDLVYAGSLVLREGGTIDALAATVGIFPTLHEGIEGTARALVRALAPGSARRAGRDGRPPASLACPSCAAEYELSPPGDTPGRAGSFACPSCAAEYEITTGRRSSPGRLPDPPRESFGCPACAAELDVHLSR